LRARPFRHLLASRTVALVGDGMVPVALAFAVLGLPGGSATALGTVLAARSVAQIAFVVLGGVLADRWPRQRLMIGAELVAAASLAGNAALFVTGAAEVPAVAALAAVNGAAAATFLPAAQGVLPDLVSTEDLRSANALLRLSMGLATVLGALVVSVLVAVIGPGRALAVGAGTFLVSALLLGRMRVTGRQDRRRGSVLADLAGGWREFRSRRWVWTVVAQFAVLNACVESGLRVLGPVVAQQSLGGATAWSLILAAQSAGRLAGSVLVMRAGTRRPLFVAVGATFGYVPPFVLLAVGAPAVVVAASLLVTGICGSVFTVLWSAMLQTHVPGQVLSRISSYDILGSYLLGPVGLSMVGWAAAAFGVREVLLCCAAICALASVLSVLTRQVRTLPAAPRDGQPANS